ncbi:hypothetical protein BVRB_037120, partial [Beta vulgaris subsp. vulgaris]
GEGVTTDIAAERVEVHWQERFRGSDAIKITVTSQNGNTLASINVAMFVVQVKEQPSINMTTTAKYKANRWVNLAPIQVDAYDAENGIVEVQLVANEADQTLPAGTRNARIKFVSSNRNSTVTYAPSFGTESRQLIVRGPLADVQTALGGIAFQTTEYGAV